MATLAEIRAQHPEYNDLTDAQLADGIHKKFYSDMPRDEFNAKIGLQAAPAEPQMSSGAALLRSVTNPFGVSDELGGALSGAISAVGGGDFSTGYNEFTTKARALDEAAAQQHPYLTTGGQIAGSIIAGGPLLGAGFGARTAAARAVPLATRVAQGMGIGGAVGAASGYASGEGGVGNRLESAAPSGLTGTLTGGILPVVARAAGAIARPAVDFFRARIDPTGTAQRIVAKRLTAGPGVDVAARRMADAAARGEPVTLADVGGEPVQRLGRTVVNLGGRGGAALKTKITNEAMAQGERIAARVDEHLGMPGMTYPEAKAAIMDARSHGATPYYDLFYQTPVPYTRRLEGILDTPAGRAGLAAARTNSLNRREPWAQWFLNVTQDGRIIDARRVPDARALDEVRRTIRAQMEEAMASPQGSPFARPRETPRSGAIRTVYDDLSNEMMAAGETRPGARDGPFAHANAAGLDNIQADEAIEFGRDIFKADPRVIAQRMGQGGPGRQRVFNPGQQDLVRVGAADAIRQEIATGNYTSNRLLKFFSSPQDLARIRPLFRTPDEFNRFRREMLNEALKRKKYTTLTGNSTTAQQLADMQDAGNLGETVQTVTDLARGRPVAAALGWLTRAARRNGILTPQVTDQIQRIISTRDLGQVQGIIQQLDNIERSRASLSRRTNAVRNLLTAASAGQLGQALATKPDGR